MLTNISKLGKNLSKSQQQEINGGRLDRVGSIVIDFPCGGDGSFIFENNVKVCCYIPAEGIYYC